MTTTRIVPDWKTTFGRRILLRIATLLLLLSGYTALVAVVIDASRAWWLAAGFALLAMFVGALAPAPVPSDLITGEQGPRG